MTDAELLAAIETATPEPDPQSAFYVVQEGRPVPCFPDYRVTPDGRVWSSKKWQGRTGWRPMVPERCEFGHLRVLLRANHNGKPVKRKHRVHVLVLRLFVGPQPAGKIGAHLDGNPANNSVGNLAWKTEVENWADRRLHGTDNLGEKNPAAKLTADNVREMRRRRADGETLAKIAKAFGCAASTVSVILSGKYWSHVV